MRLQASVRVKQTRLYFRGLTFPANSLKNDLSASFWAAVMAGRGVSLVLAGILWLLPRLLTSKNISGRKFSSSIWTSPFTKGNASDLSATMERGNHALRMLTGEVEPDAGTVQVSKIARSDTWFRTPPFNSTIP